MTTAVHQKVADRACATGLPIGAAAVADIDRYLTEARRAAPPTGRGCLPEEGPICRACGQPICDHSDPVFAGVVPSPRGDRFPLADRPLAGGVPPAAGEVVILGVDFARPDHDDLPRTEGRARS